MSGSSSSPEISAACRADSPTNEIQYKTQEDVWEDLSSRFILNLPEEELASLERISFQIEQAHWYYEDFIRERNPKLPSFPLKRFSAMIFEQCPMLHHFNTDHDQAFNNFMLYKTRVPVCGAIILNETWEKCLLVKGWKSSSGWGFPKGKINEGEPESACAVREVLEETGYNLAGQINPEDVIEMTIKEQKIVLYIVPGVQEDYPFKTKTRKEISKIEWFRLADLPTWRRQKGAPGKFYLITPFIGALKTWLNGRKPATNSRKGPKSKRSHGHERGHPNHDDSSVSDSPYASYSDAHQESSSQSSSADNGPQTPSPQYSQAMANHVNVATTVESKTLDPHFARLLSGLALSAQPVVGTNDKPALSILPEEEGPPKRDTPVPLPVTSQKSDKPVGDDTKNINARSSYALEKAEKRPRSRAAMSASQPKAIPQPKTIPNRPSLASMSSSSDAVSPTKDFEPSSVSSAASTSSPTVSTASPRHSRRKSSIADISPYLSKATEIPSTAKRWKELALLESVADESARMTSVLRNMASATPAPPSLPAMTPPPSLPPMMAPAPNGFSPMGPHSHLLHGLTAVPLPSASVPPQQFQSRPDPNIIYTSGPIAQPGTVFPGPPPSMPLSRYGQFDDPFKVRPRTSQATNRPLYPSSGSMSMNQSQLSALMNLAQATGSVATPSLPHSSPMPAPMGSSFRFPPPTSPMNPTMAPAVVGPQPQRQGPFPPLSVNPALSIFPPGTAHTPGPLSAPAISPGFNMASQMPNNNPLLSILNGYISGPAGAHI